MRACVCAADRLIGLARLYLPLTALVSLGLHLNLCGVDRRDLALEASDVLREGSELKCRKREEREGGV